LETGFDHIERMSCESTGYSSGKAGNGLNQRRGEARMVVVHRVMRWACFCAMMKKADGEVEAVGNLPRLTIHGIRRRE
jgi:hypothetical protein